MTIPRMNWSSSEGLLYIEFKGYTFVILTCWIRRGNDKLELELTWVINQDKGPGYEPYDISKRGWYVPSMPCFADIRGSCLADRPDA